MPDPVTTVVALIATCVLVSTALALRRHLSPDPSTCRCGQSFDGGGVTTIRSFWDENGLQSDTTISCMTCGRRLSRRSVRYFLDQWLESADAEVKGPDPEVWSTAARNERGAGPKEQA